MNIHEAKMSTDLLNSALPPIKQLQSHGDCDCGLTNLTLQHSPLLSAGASLIQTGFFFQRGLNAINLEKYQYKLYRPSLSAVQIQTGNVHSSCQSLGMFSDL